MLVIKNHMKISTNKNSAKFLYMGNMNIFSYHYAYIIDYFHGKSQQNYEKNHAKGGAEVIYENIKELCKKKKISIYRIEKDLGFSASSIVKWKKAVPAADKLKAVADYLGVTMEYLLADQKEAS